MINHAEIAKIELQTFALRQHGEWSGEIIIKNPKPNFVPEPFEKSHVLAQDGAQLFDNYISSMKKYCGID